MTFHTRNFSTHPPVTPELQVFKMYARLRRFQDQDVNNRSIKRYREEWEAMTWPWWPVYWKQVRGIDYTVKVATDFVSTTKIARFHPAHLHRFSRPRAIVYKVAYRIAQEHPKKMSHRQLHDLINKIAALPLEEIKRI